MATQEQVKAFLSKRGKLEEAPGDQTVYVYCGVVMLDHFPPNTVWHLNPVIDNKTGANMGMALDVYLVKPDGRNLHIKHYGIGDWSYIGRGQRVESPMVSWP